MRRFLLAMPAVLAVTLMSGCHIGPTVASSRVAHTAHGVGVDLDVDGEHFNGELLSVRDSAVLVLRSGQVLLVPFRTITTARFATTAGGHAIRLTNGRAPTAEQAERLRLASHFPQGVSPELERRLLAAYNQPALVVTGR